jgi:hypothetical protein
MVSNTAQNCAILLEQCSAVLKRFENNDVQTGRKYNIFKITYINEKEVIMCRVLADLLNPKGRHYNGDTFLNYFVEIINEKLNTPLGLDTKNARVNTEYSTDIKRRIDIVIEDGKVFIPIEVKIYAKDQKNQVSDYAQFSRLKNGNRNIPVLYLTIDGKDPDNANDNEYINISFKTDILKWLNKCLKNNDTEKTIPIREILKQLIEAVKSICGKSEDEKMENAINQLIFQSEDYVKAAVAIKQSLEALEDRPYELFRDKVLPQLQKSISRASWNEEKNGWCSINIPIKNGNYILSINYKWHEMAIWLGDSNKGGNSKEINALRKKMTELAGGATDDEWGDIYVWASSGVPYLGYPGIEKNLFFYRLNKQYLEHTSEVVNTIVNFVNELNDV